MSAVHSRPSLPRGLAFAVGDLLLLRDWAAAESLWMGVHLDYSVDGEEYEEVLAFTKMDSTLCQFIMWRDAKSVFVQPLIGRSWQFDSVAATLDAIRPAQTLKVTDIRAGSWPQ
jgi:hypothetical protein